MGLGLSVIISVLTVVALMAVIWSLSVKNDDYSYIDRVWGLGFVLINASLVIFAPDMNTRQWLITILVSIWGLRLSGYLHWRNSGHGEDPRYTEMRNNNPPFKWRSIYIVFGLQGSIMIIVAAPLMLIHANQGPPHLTWLDGVATVAWVVGFIFEALGDYQLVQFKKNPANKGQLLKTGVWSQTRHPNYFGDALQWWAFFTIAMSVDGGVTTLFSPVIMTFFLLKVSGVTLTEKHMKSSKPGYEEYVKSTPEFIPKLFNPKYWAS